MLPRVNPGDLITADFLNALIDNISDLRDRVAELETGVAAGTSVRITGFNPPPPPAGEGQRIGQVLQIFGDNFAWPPQSNTVTIQNFGVPSGGTATISEFQPGSRPNQLEFVIPTTIAGIIAAGTDVTIRVRAGDETTQATYRLRPALPTTGSPPTIGSVVRASDGNPNLLIGQQALLTGTNFGSSSAAVSLTLIVVTANADIRYPDAAAGRPGPTIDSINPTEIRFTVPDIAEVDQLGRQLTMELQVGGHTPVETFVQVRRP